MQTTRQQLLVLLKRAGSITVEQAAGALAVASMTARQHLMNLERDGLIVAEKARRATGRPYFLYSLTPKGEEMFPRRYDLIAVAMLDEMSALCPEDVAGLSAEEKRSLLVKRAAGRLASKYRPVLQSRSLEERVIAAADILHTIGGFAEWNRTDTGFELRDYNCCFQKLTLPAGEQGCEWHANLLTDLLQWPVEPQTSTDERIECCRYLINTEAAGKLEEGTALNA